MKLSKLIVTVLGLSMLTLHSYANQTGYEVELIIYEDAAKRYTDSEDWSYNDMLNQTNDAVFDADALKPDAQYSELDWEGAILSGALQKIQDSPGYNVLLAKRWRQTGLDRDKAYPVRIDVHAPDTSADTDAADTQENRNNQQQLNTRSESAVEIMQSATSINGYVRLVMSRYLHFEVNLNFHKRLETEASESVFPIVAERRMRSRETHYIDHPMIGIIVHTIPYKIEN